MLNCNKEHRRVKMSGVIALHRSQVRTARRVCITAGIVCFHSDTLIRRIAHLARCVFKPQVCVCVSEEE